MLVAVAVPSAAVEVRPPLRRTDPKSAPPVAWNDCEVVGAVLVVEMIERCEI